MLPIPERMQLVEQNTPDWDEARKSVLLKASEVPNYFGVGYETPQSQWALSLGLKQPNHSPFTLRLFAHGHETEEKAKLWYSSRHSELAIVEGGFWRHPTESWGGSPDGLLYPVECIRNFASPSSYRDEVRPTLLEVKSPQDVESCVRGSVKFARYVVQVAFQMEVCDLDNARLLVYESPEVYRLFQLRRNPAFFADVMLPRLREVETALRTRTPLPKLEKGYSAWVQEEVDRCFRPPKPLVAAHEQQ